MALLGAAFSGSFREAITGLLIASAIALIPARWLYCRDRDAKLRNAAIEESRSMAAMRTYLDDHPEDAYYLAAISTPKTPERTKRRWPITCSAVVALFIAGGAMMPPTEAGEVAATVTDRAEVSPTVSTTFVTTKAQVPAASPEEAHLESTPAPVPAQIVNETQDSIDYDAEFERPIHPEQAPVPAPVYEAPPIQQVAPSNNFASFENCTAARAAGAAPVLAGDPGYGPHLDRDGDGIGCES